MNLLKQDDGNAMIELGLILPVLILMLLAVLDIGLVLRQSIIVADSARAGAEYATTAAHAADTDGMKTAALAAAGSLPTYQAVPSSFCTCAPGGSVTSCSASCPGNTMPAQYAQITATASLSLLFNVQGLPATIPAKSVARVRTAWTGGN